MTENSSVDVVFEPLPEDEASAPRSLRGDAWRDLRRNPIFWISAVVITTFVVMAIVPQLFTSIDPRATDLSNSRKTPDGDNWFGRDVQGYDIYARCIYGARASLLIGLFCAVGTAIVGAAAGLIAGYVGGTVDAVVGRVADVFFGLPLILGAIIILINLRLAIEQKFGTTDGLFVQLAMVSLVIVVLSWPSIYRLMRSSVLQVKPQDYVQAARALGAGPLRITFSHIMPNALGPVIVVSTINLGVFISAEAALSFLGIGLADPIVSWGKSIDAATISMRTAPHTLLFPSLFLSLAVLGFIMLGDALRDAFDPKSR
ncbi:ABC transporter permease [Nocardioides salsibiostraticola]